VKFPKPGPRKKKNKYGNIIIRDPLTGKKAYDSKLERDYHIELTYREKAGEIKMVEQWPSVQLLPDIRYKPDFKYTEVATGDEVWIDTKGVIGERYRIIRKLWRLFGPGVLLEVTRGYRSNVWHVKEIKSLYKTIN
jgi:hypothetical protein